MAYDAFLYFPGSEVEGETTDSVYAEMKAMEVLSFSLGASNIIDIRSAQGGASAGKADFSQFNFMKNQDKATMALFEKLVTGKHFPEAKLALRKSGASDNLAGEPYLVFTFKLVFIGSMNWSGGTGQEQLMEAVSFDYGAIKIEYFMQNSEGALEKAGEKMWSRVKNNASESV